MGVMIIVFIWGFAEATLFFLVPDILLSIIAIRSWKQGLVACIFALFGALLGGAIMYRWGGEAPDAAVFLLQSLPGIQIEMIHEAELGLQQNGFSAMFRGGFQGVPYKIYAVKAGALNLSFPTLLIWTIPARLFRFILVTSISALIFNRLSSKISIRFRYRALLIIWILFYLVYFWRFEWSQ